MAIRNLGNHESFLKISLDSFNSLEYLVIQANALSYVSLSPHFHESSSEVLEAYLGILNCTIANIAVIVKAIK
jgi:hypothetical protein